jgi:hypothetical protein
VVKRPSSVRLPLGLQSRAPVAQARRRRGAPGAQARLDPRERGMSALVGRLTVTSPASRTRPWSRPRRAHMLVPSRRGTTHRRARGRGGTITWCDVRPSSTTTAAAVRSRATSGRGGRARRPPPRSVLGRVVTARPEHEPDQAGASNAQRPTRLAGA